MQVLTILIVYFLMLIDEEQFYIYHSIFLIQYFHIWQRTDDHDIKNVFSLYLRFRSIEKLYPYTL